MYPKWAIVPVFGEIEEGTGAKPDLHALQALVGGYIEHISGPHGEDLWINEEGKLEGLQLNPGATEYLQAHHALFPGDFIAGPMVMTGLSEKRWEKIRQEPTFKPGVFCIIPGGLSIERV